MAGREDQTVARWPTRPKRWCPPAGWWRSAALAWSSYCGSAPRRIPAFGKVSFVSVTSIRVRGARAGPRHPARPSRRPLGRPSASARTPPPRCQCAVMLCCRFLLDESSTAFRQYRAIVEQYSGRQQMDSDAAALAPDRKRRRKSRWGDKVLYYITQLPRLYTAQ